jgi:hypothetical protein
MHEQLYKVLSRVPRVALIKILMMLNAQRVTQNIIFPEVLLASPVY